MHTSALVLFSGGQDSTTCLAHALAKYDRVETLAFDYGQRHKVELDARLNVLAARMGYNGPYVAGLVTLSTLSGMWSLPFALGVLR